MEDSFGFVGLELADKIRGLVRRQRLGDASEPFGFDVVDQLGPDRGRGVGENRARGLVVEDRQNALPFVDRQEIEPFRDVLGTRQAQEDLQRVLFSRSREGRAARS